MTGADGRCPAVPPEVLEGEQVTLRVWAVDDSEALGDLVLDNLDRLRPWMPWAAAEPLTATERLGVVESTVADRASGVASTYGIWWTGRLVGSCGAHRRIGLGGLEIGYWLAADVTGRGLATDAVATLTTAALALDDVDHVEVHVDRANGASAEVPRRLGFELVSALPHELTAPGEVGIECIWRTDAARWRRRSAIDG
ncbi:MAG: GNAT family N-acetyltransferase [Acidimicrobiia bacterium]|nr:GNAT family N-acetyltransferase [Acidimicrobiia bacterium]